MYAVTNFWLCAVSDLFRVIIFASLVNFTVCAICCNLDSRSHLRLKTFKLQQTEMACLIVSETKLIIYHHSFGSYKTKQVNSQLSPSVPHENSMITKTITDFAFALIRAIMIACKSSNKKQYPSSGAKIVFTG